MLKGLYLSCMGTRISLRQHPVLTRKRLRDVNLCKGRLIFFIAPYCTTQQTGRTLSRGRAHLVGRQYKAILIASAARRLSQISPSGAVAGNQYRVSQVIRRIWLAHIFFILRPICFFFFSFEPILFYKFVWKKNCWTGSLGYWDMTLQRQP